MENNQLLEEIRYVRGRIDEVHERLNDLLADANDLHLKQNEDITRLQEKTEQIHWIAGKVSGIVAALVSAGMAAAVSFMLRRWLG